VSESPSFNVQQLSAARATLWHQKGDPLLTQDEALVWLQRVGCVLYTPRKLQMPAPAPSFVEAVLGQTTAEPTLAQTAQARELLVRLIETQQVVALNLLGTLGETPDYLVTAQALPYIFTLRGDKNWKQAPEAGSNGISPLAARLFELLVEHGAMSALDLVTQAGREVTEAAVLRSLGELWSRMRVFPRPQSDGKPTVWELASAHFTKQLKSGANAGTPTALSALTSLYLGSVIAATEEDIEVVLSPLAPRSRIRDLVHGLVTMRQLQERVVEGKTLLHLEDGLPEFEPVAGEPRAEAVSTARPEDLRSETETPAPGFTPRIKKFEPRTGAGSFKPRAGGKSFGDKKPFRKPFGERSAAGAGDRERRPFSGGADRPPRREFKPRTEGDARPPRREFGSKTAFGERKPFGAGRPAGGPPRDRGERPARAGFGGTKPSPRRDFGGKPSFTKPWEEERKPRARAAFDAAAEEGATGGHATPRYPRFDDKKPGARKFGGPPKRDYKPRGDGDAPRREYKPRAAGDAPRREYKPRTDGAARPPRSFDREGGDKKPFSRGPREFGEAKKFGAGKPFGGPKKFGDKKTGGSKSFGDKPGSPRKFGDKPFGGPKKSFGGPSKFGGAKKFGGPSKFGGPKKFGSSKPRSAAGPRKPRKEGDAE